MGKINRGDTLTPRGWEPFAKGRREVYRRGETFQWNEFTPESAVKVYSIIIGNDTITRKNNYVEIDSLGILSGEYNVIVEVTLMNGTKQKGETKLNVKDTD